MPLRLPPPGQISLHGIADPGADNPANRSEEKVETTTAQEVDRIQSKYWHNRLISFCKEKINRIIHPPPSIEMSELVYDLTKKNPEKTQHVLAALKLHAGRTIKVHQSKDGKLGFTNRKIAISTKTLEAVVESTKKSGVETAYEYIRKGKKLPTGYLQQIMLPDIQESITQALEYEKTSQLTVTRQQIQGRQQYKENPERYIANLLKQAGIEDERSFTFERMLEVKKKLRNNIALSNKEQESIINEKKSPPDHQKPATHRLPKPRRTDLFIEEEDSRHIQKLAKEERFFSRVHLKDFINRVKRSILRNKRSQIIIAIALIGGMIISVIMPPAGMAIGIAAAVSLAVDIAYISFWTTNSTLWNRVRLIRGLKQIKKYADFDYTSQDKTTDQKRKKLIKKLLYRCQHKTFTQIYNAYAELEKQSEKLKIMTEKSQKTMAESIALEKERALYLERRKKLKSSMFFFDKLFEQVIINRKILENRHQESFECLWNEKFRDMNPILRNQIFSNAAKNLIVEGHQIKTESPDWLTNIIKSSTKQTTYLPSDKVQPDKVQQLTSDESKKQKLFKIPRTFKTITQATIFRSIKQTLFINLMKASRIIGKRASITIHNPVANISNTAHTGLFIATFFLEMAAANINNRQNQKRLNKIEKSETDYTWQLTGKRERTGREQVNTVRSLAKSEIEPLISHLLKSIDSLEKMASTLADAQKKSTMLDKSQFGAMSDHDAAKLILEYGAWQQLLDKEIKGSFQLFQSIVKEKAENWHKKIALASFANSNQTIATEPDHQRQHRANRRP